MVIPFSVSSYCKNRVNQQYFYFSLNHRVTLLGWPNGSGGSLQSCYIWVQLPSPAPHTPFGDAVLLSQLPNHSRRMKTSANRIQHLRPALQQLKVIGYPPELLKPETLSHNTTGLGSANQLPKRHRQNETTTLLYSNLKISFSNLQLMILKKMPVKSGVWRKKVGVAGDIST